MGRGVVAFVVRSPAPRHELDACAWHHIARFKRPKAIASSNLPKNDYGKVLKTELRQRFQ